jgi:capsular exopolysaccharide synthesis family protein
VDAYLESTRSAQAQSGQRAAGWLEQRLSELRQDLQAKEAAVDAYRAESGLLSAEGHPVTESRLSGVQEAVMAARADLAEKEARHRQAQALIQSGGQGETMDDVLSSDVIGALRSQEAELSRRQADYESTLGPRHPFVIQGQAELTELRARIVAETRRIAEQLQNDLEISRTRLATLQSDLSNVSGQLVNDNQAQVRLGQLEREAAGARSVYESFLQRYHEVSGQGELPVSTASIVARAFPPQAPSSPRLVLVAAAALLAGLIAALIACFAAQAFNDAIVSADDVEPRIGVPALASIPMIDAKALRLLAPTDRHPPGYLIEKPNSPAAEAFRVLRSAVLRTRKDRPSTVVTVTSALPAEGKTSCSLSLARISALSGQSVLVIDGDLRRRSINDFLDIAPRSGLFEVLLGEKTWQEVVGVDEASGAHVLPLAASRSIARDIFETPAMHALIDELRSAYELIILDAAPVLVCADARTLSEHADTTIVVARWAKTSIRATASAVMQLHRADAHVSGVALNYVDPRVPGWGSYADSLYYDRARYNYDTV